MLNSFELNRTSIFLFWIYLVYSESSIWVINVLKAYHKVLQGSMFAHEPSSRAFHHPNNFFLGFPDMNCSRTNCATSLRFTSSSDTASCETICDRLSRQRVLQTHSNLNAFSWGPMVRPPSCKRSLSPTPRNDPSCDHSSPFSLYATRRSSRSLRQSARQKKIISKYINK